MSNTYQKNRRRAEADPLPGEIIVPERVVVSMTEIAEAAKVVDLAYERWIRAIDKVLDP